MCFVATCGVVKQVSLTKKGFESLQRSSETRRDVFTTILYRKTVVHKKDRKNSVSKRNIDQFIEKTENKLTKFDSDKSAVDSTRSFLS
jgi:hypothetical protein